MTLKAPFPWFGGKSRVADLVWQRFGPVRNYVEPFFGSGAVLLGRPRPFDGVETINDLDGFVANFWRAVQHAPDEVARWADWPVNETDLTARHIWLVNGRAALTDRLTGDPDHYDPKIAGWWAWGLCNWVRGGWCSTLGSWQSIDGVLTNAPDTDGVLRVRPQVGAPVGVLKHVDVAAWFGELSDRLRRVRVISGGWERVVTPSVTWKNPHCDASSACGVFLDPPYADTADRAPALYREDSLSVAHDVRAWAIENGHRRNLRIALCGYEGEHTMPESWECVAWKTAGGFGTYSTKHDNPNARRERIWFSPHCLRASQGSLL